MFPQQTVPQAAAAFLRLAFLERAYQVLQIGCEAFRRWCEPGWGPGQGRLGSAWRWSVL
ncbi:MAG: hypothetical protein JO138_20795 [Acidobacteriaceae bacterium]|nr:hypothetical protein [Acidobacteriaceae bacterium]